MKNDSVKFKKSVPKSSTDSSISGFDLEESPVCNQDAYQSFTHAQNISARLQKNSHLNDFNIRVSTPNCSSNLKQSYINLFFPLQMQDEVLLKSPMNKSPMNRFTDPFSSQQPTNKVSKFTEATMQKMRLIEEHVAGNPGASGSLKTMLDDLRLVRRDPTYFESYDGDYALMNPSLSNFCQFKTKSGIAVNCGRFLQSLILEHDTFRVNRICDNPDGSNFTAVCLPDAQFEDWVVCGTEAGSMICWNQVKQAQFRYYSMNSVGSYKCHQPTFISQKDQNFYVGTINDEVQVLDQRLNNKYSIVTNIVPETQTTPQFHQYKVESPRSNSNLQQMVYQSPNQEVSDAMSPISFGSQNFQGIRHIDVRDHSILLTVQNGFSCYDNRNPISPTFSYNHCSLDLIKVLFSPYDSEHIVCADRNSKYIKYWNMEGVVFEQELLDAPKDMVFANETRELLTLVQLDKEVVVSVFQSGRQVDQIELAGLPMSQILLDQNSENLYGMGMYSLRAWKFYDRKEKEELSYQVMKQFNCF